jgi:serine/threonine protein phosphatase PrpC
MLNAAELADRVNAWLARPSRPMVVTDLLELPAAIGTTVGEVRTENQDRAVVARFIGSTPSESWIALCLCDGMGGMADGRQCAELATAVFIVSLLNNIALPPESRVRRAVLNANAAVFRRYRERGGTTIAALVYMGHVMGVSAGDSRIYAHDPRGGLIQVSVDDSIAGELNRLNIAGDAEFPNALTQFVGIGEPLQPRMYTPKYEVQTTRWLLSSDGVHGSAGALLESILKSSPNNLSAAHRLVQLSRWCGGLDNATVVIASCDLFSPKTLLGRAGVLEIWDSLSKLELYVDRPPIASYPSVANTIEKAVHQQPGAIQGSKVERAVLPPTPESKVEKAAQPRIEQTHERPPKTKRKPSQRKSRKKQNDPAAEQSTLAISIVESTEPISERADAAQEPASAPLRPETTTCDHPEKPSVPEGAVKHEEA